MCSLQGVYGWQKKTNAIQSSVREWMMFALEAKLPETCREVKKCAQFKMCHDVRVSTHPNVFAWSRE